MLHTLRCFIRFPSSKCFWSIVCINYLSQKTMVIVKINDGPKIATVDVNSNFAKHFLKEHCIQWLWKSRLWLSYYRSQSIVYFLTKGYIWNQNDYFFFFLELKHNLMFLVILSSFYTSEGVRPWEHCVSCYRVLNWSFCWKSMEKNSFKNYL